MRAAVDIEAVARRGLQHWDCDSDGIRSMASIWQAELLRRLITTAISVARTTAPGDELSAWHELLDHRNELTWSTPEDVSLVFGGVMDPSARIDALRRLTARRGRMVPASLRYLADSPAPQWAKTAMEEIAQDQRFGGRPEMIEPVVGDISQRRAQSQYVLGLIEAVWPELALERHLLVREVVFLKGCTGLSSTIPGALGAVFIGQPEPDIGLYLTWIHEISHHALHVRMAFDRLVVNGEDRAPSALRAEPRLLVGHFHQVFVLARMCQGVQRLLPHLSGADVSPARQRLELLTSKFGLGINALRKHAVFTPVGGRLADDLERYHHRLVNEVK
ncbi:hypothetical protein LAUMK191_05643 [Mycobacterium attenuatum]|uniref:HEXXH motif domain-containing protein n=1 Tax=Mycobacterium attenuatum TaxID=2341086 RepID=A0A498QIB8_9MYCO|nr:hypothetical protein LAUMK136_05655 [Mycobacterium attenuatum]VBA60691.1 hypothetical protein LAUMK191_05643 [Mycobacterium attenuatum]VBA62496.1 hypothetical protein LAUMK41_05887 [Mycobacterium attenuatum]